MRTKRWFTSKTPLLPSAQVDTFCCWGQHTKLRPGFERTPLRLRSLEQRPKTEAEPRPFDLSLWLRFAATLFGGRQPHPAWSAHGARCPEGPCGPSPAPPCSQTSWIDFRSEAAGASTGDTLDKARPADCGNHLVGMPHAPMRPRTARCSKKRGWGLGAFATASCFHVPGRRHHISCTCQCSSPNGGRKLKHFNQLPQRCTNLEPSGEAGRSSEMRYRRFTLLMQSRICQDNVSLQSLGYCRASPLSLRMYSAEVAILYSLSQGAFLKGWRVFQTEGRQLWQNSTKQRRKDLTFILSRSKALFAVSLNRRQRRWHAERSELGRAPGAPQPHLTCQGWCIYPRGRPFARNHRILNRYCLHCLYLLKQT